jgi:Rrf2 family transcriptional regulator, cysteine metabolism repressor
MVYLAARRSDAPVRLADIATSEAIPPAFLERIMASLRDAGLVRSARGVGGGYRLALAPAQITAADVLAAIDGPVSLISCVPDDGACGRSPECRVRRVWSALDEAVESALAGVTLDDLLKEDASS